MWRAGVLEIHVLKGRRYLQRAASRLLPELDVTLFNHFLGQRQNARGLVRKYQRALRSH